jgi:Response regulator containing a CheY-like receiver domain and an HTH DNA-binding domain
VSQALMRALVVEDDSSWQQILSEILTDSGLTVDAASNLEEAFRILKSDSHRLAVVDLSLAGSDHHNSDGLRVLEAVKRLDPRCQTILLTGYATVELAVSVLTEYGAFSFLRKESFNRAQFRDLIAHALVAVPPQESLEEIQTQTEIADKPVDADGTAEKIGSVLVVEDDAGWRSILAELLADVGYEVRLSNSFGDALGLIRREDFDLAVVDLSLSGGSIWGQNSEGDSLEGFKLLETTKASSIPTIVVSGVASVAEIQKAYNEQAIFAFLEKQAFDRNTFRRLVNEARFTGKAPSELDKLTDREREVFDLLAKGATNKEIAETLVITTNTVKRHIKSIFEKLEVHNRAGAAAKLIGN